MAFAPHLRDDRLFDCYLAARSGEPLDPPAADHLADCVDCAARFAELSRFMEDLREDAECEVDALFPPDRLRQQQQQIARRIEAVGRSARVIHFPGHAAARQLPAAGSRSLPRWVAAAAAAGLFGGIAAGLFFDNRRPATDSPAVAVEALQAPRPVAPPDRPAAPAIGREETLFSRDDAFLSELEIAAGGPRTEELAAYDALTPHIREISVSMPVR